MGLNKFGQNRKQLGSPLQPAAEKMKSTGKNATTLAFILKSNGFELCRVARSHRSPLCRDMFDLARMAEVYGSSEIRLTVEQN